LTVFLALFIWLLASWSGTHVHFSFEDHESPLSAHMQITAEHADHHAETDHVDIDVEQQHSALSSTVKLDLSLLAVLVLLCLLRIEQPHAAATYPPLKPPRRSHTLRPPLRAPPAIPV